MTRIALGPEFDVLDERCGDHGTAVALKPAA
jgi:hypothetical protein